SSLRTTLFPYTTHFRSRALKGIPVDDFIQTMGLMTAALQFDCSDCHVGAGTNKVDWAADTPRKVMARSMINMVAALNKNNFGGRSEEHTSELQSPDHLV